MEVLGAKVIALILMQLLTLCAGLLPIKLISYLSSFQSPTFQSRADFAISLLNCFAGGVFLGTTFLHLIPEVIETMDGVLEAVKIDADFPVAEFIMSIGFFLIMLLEHLVMSLQHHGHGASEESRWLMPESADQSQYGSVSDADNQKTSPEHQHNCQKTLLADIESRDDNCVHIIEPTHHQTHHKDMTQVQGLRSLLLLLALSLHTIFEGLALGLQDNVQKVWTLFVAILIHKVIMAFTMGIQFTNTFRNKCRIILFMVIFSMMSPIGVGIGTAITSVSEDDFGVQVSSAVLQGIATGTFVYVTFFEVLQKEVGQDHSLLKVLVVILGYALIAVINILTPGE